jgi:hypothetical protein
MRLSTLAIVGSFIASANAIDCTILPGSCGGVGSSDSSSIGQFSSWEECESACGATVGNAGCDFTHNTNTCRAFSTCSADYSPTFNGIIMINCVADTPAPVAAPAGAAVDITCSNIPEVEFEEYFNDAAGRANVDLTDGMVKFSVKGSGASSGVNLMLVNGATVDALPAGAGLTENFPGYEIYIGSDDEPIIHVSSCLGCAPEKIVDVSAVPVISSTSFTKVWMSVTGSTITIGRGDVADNDVLINQTMSGGVLNVDRAIFTYGYGDLECVPDVGEAPATSAPVVPATPAPVAPATSAPVVPATPAPVAPATPAPVVPATPAPVVPATPAPVAPATPAPVAPVNNGGPPVAPVNNGGPPIGPSGR